MKTCSKCFVERDESEFYVHSKKTGKLRPACKACTLLSNSKWVEENLETHKQICKEWRLNNVDKERENRHRWMLSNRDRRNAWARDWSKKRQHVFTAKQAKRRALKLKQTPELTPEQKDYIDYLYWLAKDLRAVSGEDYHVDHIHPLSKGGLHEPSNLQILPKDLNLRKSDKVDF